LEFTGERFIPGIDDAELQMEHYQRYYSVLPLVKDKIVVDAACGEGYGTRILSQDAKSVIGIDISQEAIYHASNKYGDKSNVSFVQGSIAELDLEDNSIDVFVSFETLEHVPEDLQREFMKQVVRVLKPNGCLVVSTPNRKVYSDDRNYQNKFHVHEFYRDEFDVFISNYFSKYRIYHQFFEVMSVIADPNDTSKSIQYHDNSNYRMDGKYYIAVATNGDLPDVSIGNVFLNDHQEYNEKNKRILTLQGEEEERNNHIAKLDAEIDIYRNCIHDLELENSAINGEKETLRSQITELENEKETLKSQITESENEKETLRSQITELENEKETLKSQITESENEKETLRSQITELENEKETLKSQITESENEKETLRSRITELENEKETLRSQITESENEKETLRNQIAGLALEKQIEQLTNQIKELTAKNADLRQTVLNKEGHIELLLEVERAYERYKKTRTYRFAKWFSNIPYFFFPIGSKRRFFGRVIKRCIIHPSFILKVLNPGRISRYFKALKEGGMDEVNHHLDLIIKADDHEPIDGSSLELVPVSDSCESKLIDSYEKLIIEEFENPEVSIVIPVYNQFDYTYNCIKSIQKQSGDVTYEIIIGDDCSTDFTERINDVVSGIKVIRNKNNLRFLLNCNNAAKYAKGKYILFLNNDTQVQENWLQPLVDLMKDESIGMVGSKLVYSDGRLQEAGGILWKDGSAWNYGNKMNPEDPEYNYVKEVDYISGAAIMIRADLWKEIGGFDERFVPAYYEDTDLAFEVRKHGYKVVYQPLSVVVHFEGVSNGTDTSSGQKAYQVTNAKKFYDKWKDVLEKEHFDNAENVFIAKDRSRFKKHILVVDQYVPWHDQDAGCKCSYMYLLMFLKMGMQVTFIGDNFYKHEPYTTELNQFGIEVLYGNYYYNNWQDFLKENLKYFDYVYLQRPHISIKYIDLVKEYSHAKIIYFAHDLHHIREKREYEITGNKEKLESAEKWKQIEYDLFSKADVGHVVGSFEQGIMQKAFPNKPIRNIPLFIYDDVPSGIRKDFSERQDLMYVGGFGHTPNIDAVIWFGKEVMPLIIEKYPDIKWHVIGSKVTDEVKALASKNIIVDGFLSDEELTEMYKSCRIDIVPLRFGAGVKGKVVESAYYQIPLVTTSIGAEGLDDKVGNMHVVDDAKEMAEYICSIYEDYDQLRKMSDAGEQFIQQYFTTKCAEDILKLDIEL